MNVTIMGKKRDIELGCLLESQAGAEAAMCSVNTTVDPDWLLQTRLEWKEVYEWFSNVCASELSDSEDDRR